LGGFLKVKDGFMVFDRKVWLSGVLVLVISAAAQLGFGGGTSGMYWVESFQGLEWNMPLSQFRALKNSKVAFDVDPMEARVLDYLLMDSHEVEKDDPARFPGFSAQINEGIPATYVFYRGNLCLEAAELTLGELEGARLNLRSMYGSPKKEFRCIGDDFSDSYGKIRTFYHFEAYDESPATLVELVRVTGYYENQLYYDRSYDMIASSMGELMKVYLIRLSKNYLQGDNAYRDWLADKKNPPALGTKMDYLQSLKRSIEH
jgi:hypothetical protein